MNEDDKRSLKQRCVILIEDCHMSEAEGKALDAFVTMLEANCAYRGGLEYARRRAQTLKEGLDAFLQEGQ